MRGMKAEVLFLVMILIFASSCLTIQPANASKVQPSLRVVLLNSTFNVTPGSSFTVPIKVINSGNTTVKNLTISIPLLQGVIMAGWENVSMALSPGTSRVVLFPVRIMETAPAGIYNVTMTVKASNFTTVLPIHVRVELVPLYYANVSVGRRYHFGQNVTVLFTLTSQANGVLRGPVWIRIYRNGREVYSKFNVVFLNRSESWRYAYTLTKPQVGNYTAVIVANLSGRSLTAGKSFSVFRRKFTLRAWFSNGYLYAEVKLVNGTPVSGLTVLVNSMKLKTDRRGQVTLRINKPGIYVVSTRLDGVNKTATVSVESLVLSTSVEGDSLLLTVISSTGSPVPNASVTVSGPKGSFSGVTNSKGVVKVPLSMVGRGVLLISVSDPHYLGINKMITVPALSSRSSLSSSSVSTSTASKSSSSSSPSYSTSSSPSAETSTTSERSTPTQLPNRSRVFWLVSGLAAFIFVLTFYLAFLRPHVVEDELKSYYFVKVKAPRLRGIKRFKLERHMNAVEARATKGKVKVEGNRVVWEIEEMGPGEEAILQVILG